MRNDWSRSLLSVLAVALGVGVVVAIRVANRSALASFSQSTHSLSAGAQLLVTGPAPLDAALLARLRPLTAQAEFTPYLDRRAYNPADGATLEVLGLDLVAAAGRQPGSQPLSATARSRESRRLHGGQSRREGLRKSGGRPAPGKRSGMPGAASVAAEQGQGPAPSKRSGMPGIAGQGPAPINAGLWLSAPYAARSGLRQGGTVALVIDGVSHTFPVAGLLPPSAAQPADFALLDLPAALQAFEPGASPSGMPGIAGQGPAPVNFDGLRVRLAPGVNAQAIAAAIQPLLPPPDTVVTPRARTLGQERMLAAFRANLEALAYVSLLVGVFLIYNTVSISVVRRREQTATLRALGATRGQLLRLFLTEGAVLSLAGGAVGLGFGWALAAGALSLMQRTINSLYAAVQPAHASLQPWDVAWALGLGLA
ncbi:MAG: FtsX-like permease family protein, partial [Terriglobales bacterium]